MGMPWDRDNQDRRHSPEPYTPPRNLPPVPPQQMRPDTVPVSARNPQTGEQVRVDISQDLRAAIQQAIKAAVNENKDGLAQSGQAVVKSAVAGSRPTFELPESVHLESSFEAGPATIRTFMQGAALDMGAAVFAVVATMLGPDTDIFDKELWGIVGVMMVKTVIQTGLSYAMKMRVR